MAFERSPISLQLLEGEVALLVSKGKEEDIETTPGFAKASLVESTVDPQDCQFQYATGYLEKQKEESLNACFSNAAMAFPKCSLKSMAAAFNMQGEKLVNEEAAGEVKDIAIEVEGGDLEGDSANWNPTIKALNDMKIVDVPVANMQSMFSNPVQLLWSISSKISHSVKSFISVKLTRIVKVKAVQDLEV